MTRQTTYQFAPFWRARIPGRGQWTRPCIGPLALSIYRPRGDGDRWHISHSWRVRTSDGYRHAATFRRMIVRRAR